MHFSLKLKTIGNLITLMRKAGYLFLEEKEGEYSFIRPLERSGYPRFHIYLKAKPELNEIEFNLHLDQKRPVYKNTKAHSGEYDSEIVKKEKERIEKALTEL